MGVNEANQGVEWARGTMSGGRMQQRKRSVFEMQRGLIWATIGWTDRAQDLLQRAGLGQQRPAGSCSAWRAIEPGFRGVMGEALLWGPGGYFNPLLLGQEIKRFLLYFSKFPAASCFPATADSLGFHFFYLRNTWNRPQACRSFDMGYLAENRWDCMGNGCKDFAQKASLESKAQEGRCWIDEPLKWRQNGQMVWSNSKYI